MTQQVSVLESRHTGLREMANAFLVWSTNRPLTKILAQSLEEKAWRGLLANNGQNEWGGLDVAVARG